MIYKLRFRIVDREDALDLLTFIDFLTSSWETYSWWGTLFSCSGPGTIYVCSLLANVLFLANVLPPPVRNSYGVHHGSGALEHVCLETVQAFLPLQFPHSNYLILGLHYDSGSYIAPRTISKILASNAFLSGCYCTPLMMTMNTSLAQSIQENLSVYTFSEQVDGTT